MATEKERQEMKQYLLERVPGKYGTWNLRTLPMPEDVAAAKKAVKDWEDREGLRRAQIARELNALRTEARELTYKGDFDRALDTIKRLEKRLEEEQAEKIDD